MTDNRDTRGPWYPFDLRIFFRRVAAKLNSEWMRTTYPFASVGRRVSIDPSCDISRRVSRHFAIGNHVFMARGVWINIVETEGLGSPKLIIGDQCRIGRRSTISVRNRVQLEDDVLLAPNVLIMDHNHEYSDPNLPIHAQGVTEGGQIVIGRNTWLMHFNVAFSFSIYCASAATSRSKSPRVQWRPYCASRTRY